MEETLKRLSPAPVWEHFAELSAIPRPSKSEERAVAYVRAVAARHGFTVRSDEVGNVVLDVPATPGHEKAPVLILQSHLDMVCEKNRDVSHDFDRDPIRPYVDGEWVRARGTTLGADNGIGVAAALGSATDPTVEHGPLELLFTIDEETGLTGATRLDPSILLGRTLLNLDSEEDGALYVGCAGGADTKLEWKPVWASAPAGAHFLHIEVAGLQGGHSGGDIHKNRANALKLVGRVLWAARAAGVDFALASIEGGSKHNAIPREAEAVIALAPAAKQALDGAVARMTAAFRSEFAGIDEGLKVTVAEAPARNVLSPADRDRLLGLLVALPHGVLAMSPTIPGLVETSNNVAVVRTGEPAIQVFTSSRSSVAPALQGVLQSIAGAGSLAGASTAVSDGYPGWKPNLASPVLALVKDVYRRQWGKEPTVAAIHAGLECGLLGEKVPGLDMVSFGPQIEGAHSPDERVNIPSVERFWTALREVLRKFPG